MNYGTYEVSAIIAGNMKFFEIVACDIDAAHADLRAAYGDDVEIVCTTLL